jgi:hypothetical protein
MAQVTKCPVCTAPIQPVNIFGNSLGKIDCKACGTYLTSGTFEADQAGKGYTALDRAHLSGWIRDRWRHGDSKILILTDDADEIITKRPHLTPPEKGERLLLLFDYLHPTPGEMFSIADFSLADAAAKDRNELMFYVIWLVERKFIKPQGSERYSLTMEGHDESRRLREQRRVFGKRGFMALGFGDPEIDNLVDNYYAPAAKAAGFELRRLTDDQPAGLIDDQLRIRIRTAWFMVADITHGNRGAYWEAGYAEGLGRPVIYSCEKSIFDGLEGSERVHFDTSHLVTVLWERGKEAAAGKKLKDHIRATFPGDAILEDQH